MLKKIIYIFGEIETNKNRVIKELLHIFFIANVKSINNSIECRAKHSKNYNLTKIISNGCDSKRSCATTACCVISHIVNARRFITSILSIRSKPKKNRQKLAWDSNKISLKRIPTKYR